MNHQMIIFPAGSSRHIRDKLTLSRRIFLKGIGIACLGFTPFLNACDYLTSDREDMKNTGKTGSTGKILKPSIDLAAPSKTETATFAMG